MAFRKNTAQAFEILRQIHAEEKQRGEPARRRVPPPPQSAQADPPPPTGAQEPAKNEDSPPDDAPSTVAPVEKNFARLGKRPLLKAARSPLDKRFVGRRRERLRSEESQSVVPGPSPQSASEESGADASHLVPGGAAPRDRGGGRRENSSLHRWLNDQKETQDVGAERDAVRERRALLAGGLVDSEGFARKARVDLVLERAVLAKRKEPAYRGDAREVGLLAPMDPHDAQPHLQEDDPGGGAGSGDGGSPGPQAQDRQGAPPRREEPGSSGPSGRSQANRRSSRGHASGKDRGGSGVEREENASPGSRGYDRTLEGEPPTESGVGRALGVAGEGRLGDRVQNVVKWVIGDGTTGWLRRRVELQLSTLIVGALVGVVLVGLFFTWLGLPEQTDPYFAPAPAGWASAPVGGVGAGPMAQGAPGPRGVASGEGRPAVGVSRAISPTASGARGVPVPALAGSPLWSPGTVALPPAASERAPVARSSLVPPTGTALVYRIRVRARESQAGADRIFEYLESFGFGDAYIEGEKKRGGQPLFTVFVGRYGSLAEANTECDRLKRETSTRPYQSKRGFFQDCYVLRRTR